MFETKKSTAILISFILFFTFSQPVCADNNSHDLTQQTDEILYVSRGEAVAKIVTAFDLKDREKTFIASCLSHLNDCFFVFSAMTRFDGLSLSPLVLYPDVPEAYLYHDEINLATMLGLVRGNIDIKNSPFYPRAYITRIQALKVIFGAAGLMDWRDKFELVRDLGDEDTLRAQTTPFQDVTAAMIDTWWYPRYVNFALAEGIIDPGQLYYPDDPVQPSELDQMISRTLKIMPQSNDQQIQPRGDSTQQTAG